MMIDSTTEKKQEVAGQMKEPLITVRKQDGSTRRVPFSEFSKRLHQSAAPAPDAEKRRTVRSAASVLPSQPPVQEETLPAVHIEALPAIAAPVTDIFVREAAAAAPSAPPRPVRRPAPSAVPRFAPPARLLPPPLTSLEEFRARMKTREQPVRSVSAGAAPAASGRAQFEKRTTGPEEEMAGFGLTEFRRLAASPKDAATRLSAKFAGWREESFLLYLSAASAWRKSPLFELYRTLAVRSVNEGASVASFAARAVDGEALTHDEFIALVGVNKEL